MYLRAAGAKVQPRTPVGRRGHMESRQDRTNVEIVADAYEAFNRGDIAVVLGMLDENVEWRMADHHTYATDGPLVGPRAVVEAVFAHVPTDLDGFTVDVQRIVGCGDTVLAEIRYRATSTDTWQFADVTGAVPNRSKAGAR
jgi:ketosteroid isomerase-like protein